MQKPAFGLIVVILSLGTINFANATYVIRLKNGNEYLTTRYWQEGSQILFDTYGGIFGVDRAFVGKIEKTDQVIKIARVADQEPSEKNQAIAKESGIEPGGKASDAEANPSAPKDENDPIMKEFNEIKVISQNLDGMLTSELLTLSNRLTALKKKLQLEGKTNDYLREFGAIHDMGDAVEDVLKTRR